MNGYSSAFFKISKIQEEFFSSSFFPFRIVIIINNKSGPPKQVGDCLKIVIAGLMTTGLLSSNCHCRSNVPDSCVYMTSWRAPPASQFFKYKFHAWAHVISHHRWHQNRDSNRFFPTSRDVSWDTCLGMPSDENKPRAFKSASLF